MYIASYEEENAPNVVDNLIPRPMPKQGREISKMGKNKLLQTKEA